MMIYNMICVNGTWVWLYEYYTNLLTFMVIQLYKENSREKQGNKERKSSCSVYA
jgi:hypothetical protein